MHRLLVLIVAFLAVGCSKSDEKTSNAATRYAESLAKSVQKTRAAEAKANEAIRRTQEAMDALKKAQE